MTTAENWRPVAGYEGLYEVSDLGRVRSLGRVDTLGRIRKPRLMRPSVVHRTGYVQAMLTDRRGGRRQQRVHRLVLEAFLGPCPEGMESCHGNGIRTDNRLANLRWGTHRSNQADQRRHGTNTRGERNGRATLTEVDVERIRDLRISGAQLKQISAWMSVPISTVWRAATAASWSHL